MYTVVLMAAMTQGAAVPDGRHGRGGCCGSSYSTCSGYYGGGYGGYGCSGSGYYGGYGCSGGGYYGSPVSGYGYSGGCTGGAYYGGCTGGYAAPQGTRPMTTPPPPPPRSGGTEEQEAPNGNNQNPAPPANNNQTPPKGTVQNNIEPSGMVRTDIVVTAPQGARLIINGAAMPASTSPGINPVTHEDRAAPTTESRSFQTAPLVPGQQYSMTVRAEVERNGTTRSLTRQMLFRAGEPLRFSFNESDMPTAPR